MLWWGKHPPFYTRPPFFLPDRVRLGVPILPVEGASELTCTTMHGFFKKIRRTDPPTVLHGEAQVRDAGLGSRPGSTALPVGNVFS